MMSSKTLPSGARKTGAAKKGGEKPKETSSSGSVLKSAKKDASLKKLKSQKKIEKAKTRPDLKDVQPKVVTRWKKKKAKDQNLSNCLVVKDIDKTDQLLQYDVLRAGKSFPSLKYLYEKKHGIRQERKSPNKPFSAIMLMIMLGLNSELLKKQQNSLIAGLRATNEFNVQQDLQEDKSKENNVDKETESELKHEKSMHFNENKGLKETEGGRVRVKAKASTAIPRSDSVGSASGRKYLAPTLSDPTRPDKEKVKNSKRNRTPVEGNDVQKIQQREMNSKPHVAKVSSVTLEVRDWWSDQLAQNSDSSEDE